MQNCIKVTAPTVPMADRHGDISAITDAPEMMEIDAHIGLLCHAITKHEQSCAVLLCAVRALQKELTKTELSPQKKLLYVRAFQESGAFTSLWKELAMYHDRHVFVLAVLELLVVVADTGLTVGFQTSLTDCLHAAAQIGRYMANNGFLDCVLQLLLVLGRLVPFIVAATADHISQLIDIVARIMVASPDQTDVATSSFLCLSEIVLAMPSLKLSDPATTIIVKALSTHMHCTESHVVQVALAALPVVLNLVKAPRTSSGPLLSMPLVTFVLSAVAQSRDLEKTEAAAVQAFICDSFHVVVQQFCETASTHQTPSMTLTRNLSIALLWRSHAVALMELHGVAILLDTMEAALASRNKHLLVTAACALHHLCTTMKHKNECSMALDAQRGLQRLVRCATISIELASDELLDRLVAAISSLAKINSFAARVADTGGLQVASSVLRNRAQFPLSSRRTIQLLAAMYDRTGVPAQNDSILLVALAESRGLLAIDDDRQHDFIRAMLFACPHNDLEGATAATVLPSGTAKDIVRLIRSRMADEKQLVDLTTLVLHLLAQPTLRLEMIDNGIVQVIARAIYIHQDTTCLTLLQSLQGILSHTSHSVDMTRTSSVLQTLVHMWKQSLTPPSDMDTFVDSLELTCCVVAALSRLKTSSMIHPASEWHNLTQLLRNIIDDHDQVVARTHERILRCCVYALQNLLATQGESIEATENGRRYGEVLTLVIQSINQLINHTERSSGRLALIQCCRFVRQLMATFTWGVQVSVRAGWIETATSILLSDGLESDVLEPVLTTTAEIVVAQRRTSQHDRDTGDGLFTVLVRVVDGLASHGANMDISCLHLALRALEVVVMYPEYRSYTSIQQCLVVLRRVVQAVGFGSRDGGVAVMDLCANIVQELCDGSFLDVLLTKFQATADNLFSSTANKSRVTIGDQGHELRSNLLWAVEMVLLVDHQRAIVVKLSHQRQVHQIASRLLLEYGDSSSSALSGLWNALATGQHLLSSHERHDMRGRLLASLANEDSSLLWLYDVKQEPEIRQCINALVEAIAGNAQHNLFEPLDGLCAALVYLLRHSTTDDGQSLMKSSDKAIITALAGSILPQWQSGSAGHVSILLVTRILELVAFVLGKLPPRDASRLHFDIPSLSEACFRALSECLFTSAIMNVHPSCGDRRSATFASLLHSSSVVFRLWIAEGVESTELLFQHPTIQQLLQSNPSTSGQNGPHAQWCWSLASAVIQEHGVVCGRKVFAMMPSPGWTMCQALDGDATFGGNHPDQASEAHPWMDAMDAIATATGLSGWEQLLLYDYMTGVRDAMQQLAHPPRSRSSIAATASGVDGTAALRAAVTRLGLVLMSLQLQPPPPTQLSVSVRGEFCECCADLMELTQHLSASSTLLPKDFLPVVATLLLRITRVIIREIAQIQIGSIMQRITTCVVGKFAGETMVGIAYLKLATAAFFGEDTVSSTVSFLEDCSATLVSLLHLHGFEESEVVVSFQRFFSAMADFVEKHWADTNLISILASIAHVCWTNRRVLHDLFQSLFDQPNGVDHLLAIASIAAEPDDTEQQTLLTEEIFLFFRGHASGLRHKLVHAGEREMTLLLHTIQSNSSVLTDDRLVLSPSSPCELVVQVRSAKSSRVLEAALLTLKTFVRGKQCAISCCAAHGLRVMYSLLSSAVQDETTIVLALEICCYLTAHEENLCDPTVFPLVKLLFLITEIPAHGHAFVRLAFVILDQCVTLASPQFTFALTQMARTHLWKWRSHCTEDEVDTLIGKLYTIQHDLIRNRTTIAGLSIPTPASGLYGEVTQEVTIIKQAILDFHSVVEYTPAVCREPRSTSTAASFIDVRTSVKTTSDDQIGKASDLNPYATLRLALLHLREHLKDPVLALNRDFVDEILGNVVRVVILHTSVTSDAVCIAMDIISKLSFILRPIDLLALVDIHELLSSCALHCPNSLVFALSAASFCENIAAEARTSEPHAETTMLQLLFALLQRYPEDFDIAQSCIVCLDTLLTTVSVSSILRIHENPVALLNSVSQSHAHDVVVLWNCTKCLLRLVPSLPSLDKSSARVAVVILLNVVRANLSHSFIAQLALACLDAIDQREPQVTRQKLLEMGAMGTLVDAMRTHLDDDAIVSMSMKLLVRVLDSHASGGSNRRAAATRALIDTDHAHWVVLAVCWRQVNNARVCSMAIELLLVFVELKEDRKASQTVNGYSERSEGGTATRPWQERVVNDLLHHGVVRLVFAIIDNVSLSSDQAPLVTLVLELLYDLTCSQPGRDAFHRIDGLHKLRTTVDIVWGRHRDLQLLESALDCLVNAACSSHFTAAWCAFPRWLTTLADSLHEQEIALHCAEKIIGILVRLAVHAETGNDITETCSQTLLQMLAFVGNSHPYLESSLVTLLSQLCFEPANIHLLIVFDAIPTTIERIACHLQDGDEDDLLASCLHFLLTMAANEECIEAFHEKALQVVLHTIMDNPKSSSQVQQVASELADLCARSVVPVHFKSKEATRSHASSTATEEAIRSPQLSILMELPVATDGGQANAEASRYRELLSQGDVFRVRRDPKEKKTKKTRDKIAISLADSGEYFLLRNLSVDPPTVERVFVSQMDVLRNEQAVEAEDKESKNATRSRVGSPRLRSISLVQALSIPSLVRTTSRADCIFHLMIKKELVSLEASSPQQRREWETALQWIVTTTTASQ